MHPLSIDVPPAKDVPAPPRFALAVGCVIIAATTQDPMVRSRGLTLYELTVERDFSAAHLMRGHPGACARMHGHNYRVALVVAGEELDDCGILMDFADLKRVFDGILSELDHRYLNEIAPFDEINPSSENLARYIYGRSVEALGEQVKVVRVTVYESATSSVTYYEE